MGELIPAEHIQQRIYLIRGHKVMLDRDLAELYQVPTKVFNQAVKRHRSRFPSDFMFELANPETKNLRSQSVTSSWGGHRHLPHAFTEQGVAMLSSILNSERAIRVNIAIVRAFVRLREILSANKELAQKLAELESKIQGHDADIASLFEAMRSLTAPISPPAKRIGFDPGAGDASALL